MKKFLPVSILVCALSLPWLFSGCAHEHKFSEWEIVMPGTCMEDGLRRRTCLEDGYTEEEVIKAPGYHEYDESNTCIRCGLKIKPSEGLAYEPAQDGQGLIVSFGSCTETTVIVPAYHGGQPVVGVREEGFANPDNVSTSGGALEYIWLPDGIVSIGARAFYGCKSLKLIVLPNTLATIGDDSFSGCSSLRRASADRDTDVTPQALTSIGRSAFNNCVALVTAPLEGSLKEVGAFAFRGCISLTAANFGGNVETVGESAFSECTGLRYVTLSSKMESIATSTFFSCSSLIEVKVPRTFKYFGANAFGRCSALHIFRYDGTKQEWIANVSHADDWVAGEYESDKLPTFYIECSDGYLDQYNVERVPPKEG